MLYDRKIRYIDLMKKGRRVRGAGFIKLEVRGESCNITVSVQGLSGIGTTEASFLTKKRLLLESVGRQVEMCELELAGGKGFLQINRALQNLCGGITYGELESVRIPLSNEWELLCIISENKVYGKETTLEDREVAEEEAVETIDTDREEEISQETMPENPLDTSERPTVKMEPEIREGEIIQENAEVFDQETAVRDEGMRREEEKNGNADQENRSKLPAEDKWQQLLSIYPHIRPFRDEREYLRVGPEDFVILGASHYRLVNNSFLLHGYYNYRHLILARQMRRGNAVYYLGVPGNFYDREKQAALMFGFESFECMVEPAGQGEFGYYMIRVEL